MAVIDELLVGLGFDYDPKDLDKFKKGMTGTVNIVKKLATVGIAAAASINAITATSLAATDEQGKLADEIGETVEQVVALQHALQIAGGSSSGMGTSLQTLSIRVAEASRGVGSGVEAFGLLGISVTDLNGELKSTSDILLEVSKEMEGLDKARQIELADKLGLRDSIRLLQLGPDAIRELTNEAKELGVATSEDAKIAAQFQDSLVDVWSIVKQIARVIARELGPTLVENVKIFKEWWKINRDVIESKIPEFIDKFTMAMKLLVVATGAFLAFRLVTHLFQLVTLMRSLTVATLATNVAMFLLPALVALAITAIAALAQDAKVFFEGGESFIGDMIEKYPIWATQLEDVATIFAAMYDLTVLIFEGWKGIIGLIDKFSVENFREVMDNIPSFLADVIGIEQQPRNELTNPVGTGDPRNFTRTLAQTGRGFIPGGNEGPTIIENIEINVNGAGDPNAVGKEVLNIIQQTSEDLSSPVDQ